MGNDSECKDAGLLCRERWSACALARDLATWAEQAGLRVTFGFAPDSRLLLHEGFYYANLGDEFASSMLSGIDTSLQGACERLARRISRLQGAPHVPGVAAEGVSP